MLRPVDQTQNPSISATQESKVLEGVKKYVGNASNTVIDTLLDESVAISSESRDKLAKVQEAEHFAKLAPQEELSPRREKIERLKALVADNQIGDYLRGLENSTLADSIMQHLLKPSFT